jgi:hypothetical protein
METIRSSRSFCAFSVRGIILTLLACLTGLAQSTSPLVVAVRTYEKQ